MTYWIELNEDGIVVARYESPSEPYVPGSHTIDEVSQLSGHPVEEPRF